jgi:hypothetical protein
MPKSTVSIGPVSPAPSCHSLGLLCRNAKGASRQLSLAALSVLATMMAKRRDKEATVAAKSFPQPKRLKAQY